MAQQIEKPDISPQMYARCNELFKLLQERTYTKDELCEHFHTNERTVREMISVVSHYRPVISTSDSRGYRIARTLADVEEVRHTWAELSSRTEEIEKRMAPLIKFIEKAEQQQRRA